MPVRGSRPEGRALDDVAVDGGVEGRVGEVDGEGRSWVTSTTTAGSVVELVDDEVSAGTELVDDEASGGAVELEVEASGIVETVVTTVEVVELVEVEDEVDEDEDGGVVEVVELEVVGRVVLVVDEVEGGTGSYP